MRGLTGWTGSPGCQVWAAAGPLSQRLINVPACWIVNGKQGAAELPPVEPTFWKARHCVSG